MLIFTIFSDGTLQNNIVNYKRVWLHTRMLASCLISTDEACEQDTFLPFVKQQTSL